MRFVFFLAKGDSDSGSGSSSGSGSGYGLSPLSESDGEDIFSSLSNISIELPRETFENRTDKISGLTFSVYPKSSLFPLADDLNAKGFTVGTPVVGATVANAVISVLSQPVIITLPITIEVCYLVDHRARDHE